MDEQEAVDRVEGKVQDAEALLDRHGRIFRWTWMAAGVVVVVAGLAMTIVPGPVTVVVPAGLVMLAAVFGWARRLLRTTVEKGAEAQQAFARADRWVRWLGYAATSCVAAAAVALTVL